jgi:hypothetical protein
LKAQTQWASSTSGPPLSLSEKIKEKNTPGDTLRHTRSLSRFPCAKKERFLPTPPMYTDIQPEILNITAGESPIGYTHCGKHPPGKEGVSSWMTKWHHLAIKCLYTPETERLNQKARNLAIIIRHRETKTMTNINSEPPFLTDKAEI